MFTVKVARQQLTGWPESACARLKAQKLIVTDCPGEVPLTRITPGGEDQFTLSPTWTPGVTEVVHAEFNPSPKGSPPVRWYSQ